MNTEDRPQTLRISVDELEHASPAPRRTLRSRTASYGNIAQAAPVKLAPEKNSVLLHAWFYLGAAGLAGSLAGWAIAEPGFADGPGESWGNLWLMPMVVSLLCVGLAVAESLVERSSTKALRRAGLSFVLGTILGFLLDRAGDMIYDFAISLCGAEAQKADSPGIWLARGAAWAVTGIAGGLVYGLVGRSAKKAVYGALGGGLGAALGGILFDPISLVTHGGAPSRAVGLGLLGLATGSAMGLVESAFKNRWLYVTAGPLAGKQFILYKEETTIGSNQTCDIYLFKDPEIESLHATLQLRASSLYLQANGPVSVFGESVVEERMLENGAEIQVGRYGFRYQEKER